MQFWTFDCIPYCKLFHRVGGAVLLNYWPRVDYSELFNINFYMATFDDLDIVSLASGTAGEELLLSSEFYTTDEDHGTENDSDWLQIIFVGF